MARQVITIEPYEEGTAKVTVTPKDEEENALTFADLTDPEWQLMKIDGTEIEGCTFADSNLTSLSWLLTEDDLVTFSSDDNNWRVLEFKAKYDSDLGSGVPLIGSCEFQIQDVLSTTDEESS